MDELFHTTSLLTVPSAFKIRVVPPTPVTFGSLAGDSGPQYSLFPGSGSRSGRRSVVSRRSKKWSHQYQQAQKNIGRRSGLGLKRYRLRFRHSSWTFDGCLGSVAGRIAINLPVGLVQIVVLQGSGGMAEAIIQDALEEPSYSGQSKFSSVFRE